MRVAQSSEFEKGRRVRMLLLFFDGKRENQYGGPGGIRTPEVVDKGFTVLPIWPLWNRPKK